MRTQKVDIRAVIFLPISVLAFTYANKKKKKHETPHQLQMQNSLFRSIKESYLQ